MKLSTTLRRLATRQDNQALRRGARDVGHELPRKRIKLLSEFRSALASLHTNKPTDFVLGYRCALEDVVAAYEDAVTPTCDTATVIRVVDQHKHWYRLLWFLEGNSRTVSSVAKHASVSLSVASRALSRMRGLGLVEDCVLTVVDDKRTRLYQLTNLGKSIL